ncbi:peptidylprolyl isomerase [Geobacter argillaceus]|uniref:Peptidyl-prolyl cis-trans isomerase C n=1 Tax=Geobacter argillaceus TaxID=345631 RepID=A0A562VFL0_9BACT|nr:peptidylprolyl isomerase [Geobacter argillaceus]TWJ16703.1 peptidyl-prolyl cis-trans isomerase C [Geobacter argillaceus]
MASFFNDWHCEENRCGMFGFCAASGIQPSAANEPPVPERCLLPVNQRHTRLEDGCPDIEDMEMNARSWRWLCSLVLLLGMIVGAVSPGGGVAWAKDVRSTGGVAALVNGVEIDRDEFRSELERVQRQQGTKGKLADESKLAELQREALENLITRELLYQESRRQKVTVDTGAVDRQMEQLAGQFSDEGQFTKTLEKIGTSKVKVREQIARGLAIRALIDATIGTKITVSDDELLTYYDQHRETFTHPPQVHLSHILIAVEPTWPKEKKQAAKDRIAGLRKRLIAGEAFASLATEHSDCQSKSKGGDLGWFTPGQLTPQLEKQVNALPVGRLSPIVEDRFGFHVLKVLERKAAVVQPLEEVKGRVKGLVKQEKGLKELQPLVKKLREGARVELRLVGE